MTTPVNTKNISTNSICRRLKNPLTGVALIAFVAACGGGGGGSSTPTAPTPTPDPVPVPSVNYKAWMHSDIEDAWADGYTGDGARILVVDDHVGSDTFSYTIDGSTDWGLHGDAVSLTSSLIAPDADIAYHDYSNDTAISLDEDKFNVINASYTMPAFSKYSALDTLEQSIVDAAAAGDAVVVQAAGNSAVRISDPDPEYYNTYDILSYNLRGLDSVIFAGALETNGSVSDPASSADYTNYPGADSQYQDHFLMVGVDYDEMGTAGTSFAAPIIAGYAAVVHSKFTDATPVEVTNQLLDTATTDTIKDYDPYYHGQGEASLRNALAPVSIQ